MKSDGRKIQSERPEGPLTDLERSEFYLREGERLAHMGSWSLRADGIFDYWSPETFVIFGFDPNQGILTLRSSRYPRFRWIFPIFYAMTMVGFITLIVYRLVTGEAIE